MNSINVIVIELANLDWLSAKTFWLISSPVTPLLEVCAVASRKKKNTLRIIKSFFFIGALISHLETFLTFDE